MYKIEITAETLAELAGKAMSLAAKLNTGTATEAPTRLRITAACDLVREVAEAKTPNAETQAAIEEVEKGETVKSETVEAAIAELNEPEALASELNFDTDIAPLVLQVVKDKGKPVAQEILSQFGVEKASNLDTSRWPELVAALQDAL
jgi:hypothetical protein